MLIKFFKAGVTIRHKRYGYYGIVLHHDTIANVVHVKWYGTKGVPFYNDVVLLTAIEEESIKHAHN